MSCPCDQFLEVPEFDMDRLREGWREAVFALYLADDWYRQPPGDAPRELTYVDEDTFWSEF